MKGEISLLGKEDEPVFWKYVLPDQPEFLNIFYKLFQLRQTQRIRSASVLLAIVGKCTPGIFPSIPLIFSTFYYNEKKLGRALRLPVFSRHNSLRYSRLCIISALVFIFTSSPCFVFIKRLTDSCNYKATLKLRFHSVWRAA